MPDPKGFYRFEIKFHSLRSALSPQAAAAYRAAGRTISKTNRSTNPVRSMAYRSGSEMKDKDGEIHDFTNRSKVVERSAILAPAGAPSWVFDRQRLWEEVRAAEKRVDARWMQEAIGTLPYGLNSDQRWELAHRFAQDVFVAAGMIVDFSVHLYGAIIRPGDEDFLEHMREWREKKLPFLELAEARANDEGHVMVERDGAGKVRGYRLRQPHVHFSMPTRAIGPAGFGLKPEEWWARPRIREWRKAWQDAENAALEAAGRPERVDCRTLKAQGIDRKPQIPHGLAKRLKQPNERMKERLDKSADILDFNKIAAAVQRVVIAGVTHGPGAAVLTGMDELGLLPEGTGQVTGSLAHAVVVNVERALGGKSR